MRLLLSYKVLSFANVELQLTVIFLLDTVIQPRILPLLVGCPKAVHSAAH